YTADCRVDNIVGVLQIVFFQVGDQVITEATGFQRYQVVLLTPHLVNGVKVFGADTGIRFETDVVLSFHEVEEIVVVPPDQLLVAPGTVALGELEAVPNETLQALKGPQENSFGLSSHLLGDIRVICPVGGLVSGGQDQLSPVEAVRAIIQGL